MDVSVLPSIIKCLKSLCFGYISFTISDMTGYNLGFIVCL